jgi:hypothetical protein
MKHMGWGDYFSRSVKLPDGTSHVQRTAEVVIGLLKPPESGGEMRLRPGPAPVREAEPVVGVPAPAPVGGLQ